ncbi:transcriptional regulator, y4mF family [Nocardia otitidiscaviarum]|uniref:Transcriptional regulator, y4mF family n=1 Tax=Nocardia otitidiscaviarum TaxID=1823 RepID=A0A379JLU2_9NOCA|nr:transcriptional regulator, y4mF family [Nocardia otitidiscaviarum]
MPVSRTVISGFDPAALAAAMDRAGFDVSALVRRSRVGKSTIQHWLGGTRRPQIHQLAKVAEALEVKLSDLIVVAPEARMLSYYRNIRGCTQVDIATAAGLPTSTVSTIERGELLSLTDAVVTKLAAALEISEAEFRDAYRRTQDRPPGTPA